MAIGFSFIKKDLKRAGRQGRDLTKLRDVLETLAIPKALPPDFRDHKLKGEWQDFRECHLEPDWVWDHGATCRFT